MKCLILLFALLAVVAAAPQYLGYTAANTYAYGAAPYYGYSGYAASPYYGSAYGYASSYYGYPGALGYGLY